MASAVDTTVVVVWPGVPLEISAAQAAAMTWTSGDLRSGCQTAGSLVHHATNGRTDRMGFWMCLVCYQRCST